MVHTRSLSLFAGHAPAWLLIAFTAALLSVLLGGFQYPPLADYVEWMYQSYVLSYLTEGGQSAVFYVRDYPVPYLLSQAAMLTLDLGLGPLMGSKALIALYLTLGAVLSVVFVNRHQLDPLLAYPLLMCCIVCNSSFWSGYINYQFGLLMLMAYLSLPKSMEDKPWVNLVFGLLAFSSHGFCVLAFVIIGGIRALVKGWRTTVMFALACLPMAVLTLWYILARSNDAMPTLDPAAAYFSPKFFAYKFYTLTKTGPYQNFLVDNLSDHDRMPLYYYGGVLINGLTGLALVGLMVRFVKRAAAAPEHLALGLAALLMGVMYWFAPSFALQVVNPGERLLYPMLICVFVLALNQTPEPLHLHPRLRPIGAGIIYATMAASVGSLGYATAHESPPGSANAAVRLDQDYRHLLYWHRPYQFQLRYEHMAHAYEQHTAPIMPLVFPTSMLGYRQVPLAYTDGMP
jgi:hypothetical protein